MAPVVKFSDEAHAIRLANAQQYGLAAYLFTENHNRAIRVADQIEFGLIGYNVGVISNASAPFGGVKQSGLGREGGAEGIAEYTTVQYIGMPNPHTQG